MKKFILLSALSVLLYSVPGYTMYRGEVTPREVRMIPIIGKTVILIVSSPTKARELELITRAEYGEHALTSGHFTLESIMRAKDGERALTLGRFTIVVASPEEEAKYFAARFQQEQEEGPAAPAPATKAPMTKLSSDEQAARKAAVKKEKRKARKARKAAEKELAKEPEDAQYKQVCAEWLKAESAYWQEVRKEEAPKAAPARKAAAKKAAKASAEEGPDPADE